MFTPDRLAAELNSRGYEITNRKLRDWRDKGLLPPLAGCGRGRGFGVLRYWTDDAVLGQAITVYELLAIRARTEFALLGVWFCGYEVEIEKVKKIWLASLIRTKVGLHGKSSTKDEMGSFLADLSHRLSKKLAPDIGVNSGELEALMFEILNAYLNPSAVVAIDDEDDELANTARAILYRNNQRAVGSEFLDMERMQRFLQYVNENLSVDAMRLLISDATSQELLEAHQRWHKIIWVIGLMSYRASVKGDRGELARMGRNLAITFGGLCIFALLYLDKQGYGQLMNEKLDEALTSFSIQVV